MRQELPVDTEEERITDGIRIPGRALYLLKGHDVDNAFPLNPGTYTFPESRYSLAVDSGDRSLISFMSRCRIDVDPFIVKVKFKGRSHVRIGVKKAHAGSISTPRDAGSIFRCVSSLCSSSSPETPYKSHPLYRDPLPSILIDDEAGDMKVKRRPIHFTLPERLDYLYTAAPLAYYLNASISSGDGPRVTLEGREHDLPSGIKKFQSHMDTMLRRMFHFDSIVRMYAASSAADLSTGLSQEEARKIFLMSMWERFLLYSHLNEQRPCPWHMISYVEPVPDSVKALPFLLGRLSSVYMPEYVPVTENEIVSMSVSGYLKHRGKGCAQVIRPSLKDAHSHYWLADGFPVDAVKASAIAFENRRRFPQKDRKRANIGVICNNDAMKDEISIIIDALANAPATVEVLRNLRTDEFYDTFAEGYDILQFIGHCDDTGFECRDGKARVSAIERNETPMFFFNSCASNSEAMGLIEKGSVCGIATLYRVLEEAALDVCHNFYRMLGAGYNAQTSIEAARSCSVFGKEYVLIGDGSYSCYGQPDILKPFYHLWKTRSGYRLACTVGNMQKGLILSHDGVGPCMDIGFDVECMNETGIPVKDLQGYCFHRGEIFDSVLEAVRSMPDDGIKA